MIQLKGVLEQEQQCKLYDTILIVDYVDNIPVFTFTTKHKLDDKLNQPSKAYIEVIKEGLLDLYDEISLNDIQEYLKNK